MPTFAERFEGIRRRSEQIRADKAKAEARLEQLAERRADLLAEAAKLGVEIEPDDDDPVATIRADAGRLERDTEKTIRQLEEALGL